MTKSLIQRRPFLGFVLNSLALITLALFLVGVFAPLITLEKFFIFTNEISLYSGLKELLGEGEWLLFSVIAVFSVVFPALKLLLLTAVVNLPGDRHHGPLHWVAVIGKWSMLDVFVVALLVVSVKLRGMATVEVHFGAYAFAASVLLSMFLVQGVRFTLASR